MNNIFNFHGNVREIGELRTFNSGFKTRELVCETVNNGYTSFAVFTAKKDMADQIAALPIGAAVTIHFTLDGREWQGPKGKRWFGGANAIKVDLDDDNDAAVPADEIAEDIPF